MSGATLAETASTQPKAAFTGMDMGSADGPITEIWQHWRGHVVSVEPETFWAALGVVAGVGPDIYAQIYTRALSAADQAELSAGRYVEWRIGTRCDAKGTRRTFSEIALVKREPWTAEEMAEAERFAEGWVGLFEEDHDG